MSDVTPEETNSAISTVLTESRSFPPTAEFTSQANIRSESIYEDAARDRLGFWAEQAKNLHWFKEWDEVLDWQRPFAKWFKGGKINASYNCLDRHMSTSVKNKVAIYWEGELGNTRTLSYSDLYRAVNKFASGLKKLGLKKGDRVAIYLPMIPEAVIAMQACARIGAIHSVTFAGFSAGSLKDRIIDAQAKLVITANGSYRRGKALDMKTGLDNVIGDCPSVQNIVVVENTPLEVSMKPSRDVWYHDVVSDAEDYCEPEQMNSEDPLFILYTSGTTGKPKGIVHSTGGYLTGVSSTMNWVFDIKEDDIFWCTADVGWVTGHSYIAYGPLSVGATEIMYEGAPDFPDKDRFWSIVDKYRATIFYTAPTVIRTFMKWGDDLPARHDLSSLRLLGSVGEPINPEAWIWYHKNIGKEICPIVDTWWQTETGMIVVAPLPGVSVTKPGSAQRPLPGISAAVLTEDGQDVQVGGGCMALTEPWPAMLLGLWGDPDRYKDAYWSKFGDKYFAGDAAKKDENGYYWLLGRMDDVVNVSGHRLGTMEIESALVDHPAVAESAVIAIDHDLKGQAIVAFVSLRSGFEPSDEVSKDISVHVAKKIGPIAKPEKILFTADLPKTRSGKIMRRLLRDIANGKAAGDVTTLADPSVMENLRKQYDKEGS